MDIEELQRLCREIRGPYLGADLTQRADGRVELSLIRTDGTRQRFVIAQGAAPEGTAPAR